MAMEVNRNTIAYATWEDKQMVRRMEELLHIPKLSIHRTLKDDLGMNRVASTWVPHILMGAQLQTCMDICNEILEQLEGTPDLLKWVIKCYETLVYHYNPLMRSEGETWKLLNSLKKKKKKKVHQQRSTGKVMLIFFFDYRGPIYQHYVPPHIMVNKQYYGSILCMLCGHIQRKCPDIKDCWILHHDNARPHIARATTEWPEKYEIRVANIIDFS